MGNNSVKKGSSGIVSSSGERLSHGHRERRERESFGRSHSSYSESNHISREPPPSYETSVHFSNSHTFSPSAPSQDLSSHNRVGSNTLYPSLNQCSEPANPVNAILRNSGASNSQFSPKNFENLSDRQRLYPKPSMYANTDKSVNQLVFEPNSKLPYQQSKDTSSVPKINMYEKQGEQGKPEKFAEKEKPYFQSSEKNYPAEVIKTKSQKPVKSVDTDYLLQLSEKEAPYIIREMKQNRGLYKPIFQKTVSPALLLILMKIVKKICMSPLLDNKIEVLKIICCNNFFNCLGDYISDLPTHKQDAVQDDWLFLVDRVLPFYECILSLIPQIVCLKMRELFIKTTLSIHGMEQFHKLEISEDVKNTLKKIENLIGKNNETDEGEGLNSSNNEITPIAGSFTPRYSSESSGSAKTTHGKGERFVSNSGNNSVHKKPVNKMLDKQRGKSVERYFRKPVERKIGQSTSEDRTDNDFNILHLNNFKSHNVRGVQKSVYFIDKSYTEQESPENAKFLISFAFYLTRQRYHANEIIILTTNEVDLQNLFAVKKRCKGLENVAVKIMNERDIFSASVLMISFTVNDFQGRIQTVCNRNMLQKAFLGATEGIFMIGNMMFLESLSSFWTVLKLAFQKYEAISSALPLRCQTHGKVSIIHNSENFKSFRNGGCDLTCERILSCGHQCVRRCHSDDFEHNNYTCRKPCSRTPEKCSRNHACPKFCHEMCGLCTVPVMAFGENVFCYQLPPADKNLMQNTPTLQNSNPKGMAALHMKQSNTERTSWLPCGHITFDTLQIAKELDQWSLEQVDLCKVPCSVTLECGHECSGTCGKCRQGKVHVPCNQKKKIKLACGHRTVANCSESAANCEQKCFYECAHIKCREKCGVVCTPCNRPCIFNCKHSKCNKKCSELCDRQPCTKPCEKKLVCGHPCIGFCGEPCPPGPLNCRVCSGGRLKKRDSSGVARFVLLEDCNHVVRSNELDKYLSNKSFKLEALECPICGYNITKTGRYLNYNKELHRSLFTVRYRKKAYLNDLRNTFRNMIIEIKTSSLPEEIEKHPYVYKVKDILQAAVMEKDIAEKSVLLLQFVRNIVCNIGVTPYSPLKWIFSILIDRYNDGFSSQVLKELYQIVLEYQQKNGKVHKENMLVLHLAISYFRMMEKDAWFKCHKGHVTTFKSLIISCNLCDVAL